MGTIVRDLRRLLEKVLQCERDESGKHIRYRFVVNGRLVAQTHYSHSWRGNEQIDDKMLKNQAEQMRCNLKTWKLLLLGQASKQDYLGELLKGGHISQVEYDELCGKSSNPGVK